MQNKCFFCGQTPSFIMGVALGFSGWDYHFCSKCLNVKTLNDLIKKIKEENG